MELKDKIDSNSLPKHIAIIMDGNGRWAKKRGAFRIFGHNNAVTSVRDVTEGCAELGVKYLTLYAFSTENWQRPREEINGLMELLVSSISNEIKNLNKNNIRLYSIGNIEDLPPKCRKELLAGIKATEQNTGLTLTLALSYSGRSEILRGVKELIHAVKTNQITEEDINEKTFHDFLFTKDIPDPELLIRTSGEFRISNFLLWQIAYTELYFTDVLWPDYRKSHLFEAIIDFQQRERRFGKTSEQLKS